MPIKLNTASGGGVILQGANTASDKTITIPADDGTMIYANSSNRITGDFSNATVANRLMFQTSTVNGNTIVSAITNGSGGNAGFNAELSSSDPANGSAASFGINTSDCRINSLARGTGTYLPMTFYTGGSERMRIDTSGNVGIGTSSPGAKLQVSGANSSSIGLVNGATRGIRFGADTVGAIIEGVDNTGTASYQPLFVGGSEVRFTTSSTERARIDSSGNLLVGTTTSNETQTNGFIVLGSARGYVAASMAGSTNAAGASYHLYSTGAGAYRFYVGLGGTIFATSTSITALSDVTLKENIRDIETGLNTVLALRPRRFDWKNGDGENVAGFIAQEVEGVMPDLVYEYKYTDTETKKALKMGDMVPTLVKAIQEQQAMIEELKAKVAALEAK